MLKPEKLFEYIVGFRPSIEACNAIMSMITEFHQPTKGVEAAAVWYSPLNYHCPLVSIKSRLPAESFAFEKALSHIKPFEISFTKISGVKIEGVETAAVLLSDSDGRIEEIKRALVWYLEGLDCEYKTIGECALPVALIRGNPADFPLIESAEGKEVRFKVDVLHLFELCDGIDRLREVSRFLLK